MGDRPEIIVIKNFLWTYMVTPPESTLSHPALKDNYMQGVQRHSKVWDAAVAEFRNDLCDMTIRQIYAELDMLDVISLYGSAQMSYYSVRFSKTIT